MGRIVILRSRSSPCLCRIPQTFRVALQLTQAAGHGWPLLPLGSVVLGGLTVNTALSVRGDSGASVGHPYLPCSSSSGSSVRWKFKKS